MSIAQSSDVILERWQVSITDDALANCPRSEEQHTKGTHDYPQ